MSSIFIQSIVQDCGLKNMQVRAVNGGDSNRSFQLLNSESTYFLKINDAAAYPFLFQREAEGLDALRSINSCTIPAVIKTGTAGDHQYLLLEWIERGVPAANYWQQLGEAVANLHLQTATYTGLHNGNYIGLLQQVNTIMNEWHLFYAECRILPLVKQLVDGGTFTKTEVKHADALCKKLENYFPKEHFSLLHGDLWSGNHFPDQEGKPVLFDPAVYYGHREMDIGMTRLFGGFPQTFYDAYNDRSPLETQWQQRLQLTKLYPLLVHAVVFGAQYVSQTRSILARFGA